MKLVDGVDFYGHKRILGLLLRSNLGFLFPSVLGSIWQEELGSGIELTILNGKMTIFQLMRDGYSSNFLINLPSFIILGVVYGTISRLAQVNRIKLRFPNFSKLVRDNLGDFLILNSLHDVQFFVILQFFSVDFGEILDVIGFILALLAQAVVVTYIYLFARSQGSLKID